MRIKDKENEVQSTSPLITYCIVIRVSSHVLPTNVLLDCSISYPQFPQNYIKCYLFGNIRCSQGRQVASAHSQCANLAEYTAAQKVTAARPAEILWEKNFQTPPLRVTFCVVWAWKTLRKNRHGGARKLEGSQIHSGHFFTSGHMAYRYIIIYQLA